MVLFDEKSIKWELKKEGLTLKERMGQNLLLDASLAQRIVHLSSIHREDTVIEIGPGLGALTGYLSQKAKHLHVIEKDRRFIPLLKERFSSQENISYYCEDALQFDYSQFPSAAILVGNLPYYISSSFLRRILPLRDHFSSLTLMLQKEVAQRMVASPGGKDYGILSLVVQYYASARIEEEVPPSSFYPKPQVDSALVRLYPLPAPPVSVGNEDFFFQVIRAAFQQRRKMLSNALSRNLGLDKRQVKGLMEDMGLDPHFRGERLSLFQFAQLSNHLEEEGLNPIERR